MKMNKVYLIISIFLSFCFTNVTSDYLVFNKSINDHHSVGFNSSYIDYSSDSSKFKISFNTTAHLSNNSISLDWINNSLLSGMNLEDDQDKSDFLSIFEGQDISVSSFTQMQFGFNYKDFSLWKS